MNTQYIASLPPEWADYAQVFTALGDATRQKILLLFIPGEEITLKALVDVLPLSRTSVAYHVNTLLQARLLSARKQGRELFLSLEPSPIIDALQTVLGYAKEWQARQP